jgi:hypothetical protein
MKLSRQRRLNLPGKGFVGAFLQTEMKNSVPFSGKKGTVPFSGTDRTFYILCLLFWAILGWYK